MKRIDILVIGNSRDFTLFKAETEGKNGVEFARSNGGPDGDARENGRRRVRGLPTLRGALRAYLPRKALFLSPYRGMAGDAAGLMESGVDVRTAGPLPVRSRLPARTRGPGKPVTDCIPVTDIHRSDSGFRTMLEATRHDDFGEPVYLRLISSPGGGKWQKWWCVFQACRKAAALLDAPLRRVYVAATGTARSLHVSITLKTVRNTTGHLLVAPKGSRLEDDLFLVGTGGTLSDDALLNHPGMYGGSDYRMMTKPARHRLPDLWEQEALVVLNDDERRFYHDLLRVIGDSSRSGSGVCMEYPAT